MSGYDKKQPSLNLMARRLGLTYNNISVDEKILKTEGLSKNPDGRLLGLEGIENQSIQLEYNGGRLQQERMIYDKRRSLDRAVLYSYQAGGFKKITSDFDEHPVRGLMNPNKVKQDYDEKIISIGYEYGFKPGDIFQWMGTNTYWLIYLQELTELAYFRGNCRKCSHVFTYPSIDENGKIVPKECFAAIVGPQQGEIKTINKSDLSMDVLNNTIKIWVPNTEELRSFFDRRIANNGETYDKFLIKSLFIDPISWDTYHIENADWISNPNIIEVTALEVHSTSANFDENGLFIPDVSDTVTYNVEDFNDYVVEDLIVGETFIKPTIEYEYKYDGEVALGDFVIEGNKAPVHIIERDHKHIKLKWTRTHSGQFNLIYRTSYPNPMTGLTSTEDITKVIVAESLF